MNEWLNDVVTYWPIMTGVAVLIGLAVETRIQVRGLIQDKSEMKALRKQISDQDKEITGLRSWKTEVDKMITPEAMQRWGQVQDAVDRHGRAIERLQGHGNGR